MNYISSNSIKFIRKIGISDIQRVRAALMQVAIFSEKNLFEQIEGAILACDKMNMRLRMHLNAKRLKQTRAWDTITFNILNPHRSKDYDIIEYYDITKDMFSKEMNNVDTIIIPSSINFDRYEIKNGITELWDKYPRENIISNSDRYSEDYSNIFKKYNMFDYDLNETYELFLNGGEKD